MNRLRLKPPAPAGQRGMTLVEILVAIVVLSIGLLGMAGLQLKGMQVNQGSVYRWQAAMLAEDIADRMRADRNNAVNNNAYTLAMPGTPASGGSAGTAAAINDWWQHVATLPGAGASIGKPVVGPTGSVEIDIQITWADTRAQAAATNSPAASKGVYTVTLEL